MKTKALARVNAIFGLISGIVLLLAPLVMFMIAVGAAAATEDSDATVGVSIVYYKDDERVTPAPSVLFIVGGSVGLITFLGWVGGILTIIGGSLYFGLLKKFEIQE